MRSAVFILAMALLVGPAMAAERGHAVCWRGKPAPDCQGFIITDFGIHSRLDDDPTGTSERFHASLDLGYAHNTSTRGAFGGTLYLASGIDHARVGVRGRYRRWINDELALDIAPGVLVYGSEDNGYVYQAPGLIVGATFGWRDLAGVTVEAEHSRYELPYTGEGRPAKLSDTTWRAGLKLGTAPGVIGTLAIVTLFALAVAAAAD